MNDLPKLSDLTLKIDRACSAISEFIEGNSQPARKNERELPSAGIYTYATFLIDEWHRLVALVVAEWLQCGNSVGFFESFLCGFSVPFLSAWTVLARGQASIYWLTPV